MSQKLATSRKNEGVAYCQAVDTLQAARRKSCHHCGNMRKKQTKCSLCPYIFCNKCSFKMKEQHGGDIFERGCPVCLKLCCCYEKTHECDKMFHCYKKCLVYKKSPRSKRFSQERAQAVTPPNINSKKPSVALFRFENCRPVSSKDILIQENIANSSKSDLSDPDEGILSSFNCKTPLSFFANGYGLSTPDLGFELPSLDSARMKRPKKTPMLNGIFVSPQSEQKLPFISKDIFEEGSGTIMTVDDHDPIDTPLIEFSDLVDDAEEIAHADGTPVWFA